MGKRGKRRLLPVPLRRCGWREDPLFWVGQSDMHDSTKCFSGCTWMGELGWEQSDGRKHEGIKANGQRVHAYGWLRNVANAINHDAFEGRDHWDFRCTCGAIATASHLQCCDLGACLMFYPGQFDEEDKFVGPYGEGREDVVPLHYRAEEEQEEAAAVAASILSRYVSSDSDDPECRPGFPALVLALQVLRDLPPRVSVTYHPAVATLLAPSLQEDEAAMAIHTLACIGPQAVAEHFEEVVEAGAHGTTYNVWLRTNGKPNH